MKTLGSLVAATALLYSTTAHAQQIPPPEHGFWDTGSYCTSDISLSDRPDASRQDIVHTLLDSRNSLYHITTIEDRYSIFREDGDGRICAIANGIWDVFETNWQTPDHANSPATRYPYQQYQQVQRQLQAAGESLEWQAPVLIGDKAVEVFELYKGPDTWTLLLRTTDRARAATLRTGTYSEEGRGGA